MKNCIQLAACEANELLPMIPDLPADLFTSCLTTPIKIALRWYVVPASNPSNLTCLGLAMGTQGIYLTLVDQVPGMNSGLRVDAGDFLSGLRMRFPPGQVCA